MKHAKLLMALLTLGWFATAVAPVRGQPAPGGTAPDQVSTMVELVWLSDPLLCVYYPRAQVVDNALVVVGEVPTDGHRARALELAKRVTTMPVVDRIKIHPGLTYTQPTVPPNQLLRSAALQLKNEFPNLFQQMKLGYAEAGQVIVSGPIPSLEARLLVSQKLRQVSGCQCIQNQLEVTSGTSSTVPVTPPVTVQTETKTPAAPPAQPVPAVSQPPSRAVSLPGYTPPGASPYNSTLAPTPVKQVAPVNPSAYGQTNQPGIPLTKIPAPGTTPPTSPYGQVGSSVPVKQLPPTKSPTAPVAVGDWNVSKVPATGLKPVNHVTAVQDPKNTVTIPTSPYGQTTAPRPLQTVAAPKVNTLPVAAKPGLEFPRGNSQAPKSEPQGEAVRCQALILKATNQQIKKLRVEQRGPNILKICYFAESESTADHLSGIIRNDIPELNPFRLEIEAEVPIK